MSIVEKTKIIDNIILNSPNRLRDKYFIRYSFDLYNEILLYTKTIDISFKQRVWHWVNNESDYIYCKECNLNRVSFKMNWRDGYKEFCSNKCSSNNKQFWYDWHELNQEAYRIKIEVNPCFHGLGDEQDTLNQIFHSEKYTSKIIDAIGTNLSYGLCNTWGEETHWDSWKNMYIKNNSLYLDDPVNGDRMNVRVLHQAGGSLAAELNKEHGGLRNWFKTVFNNETLNYINNITK